MRISISTFVNSIDFRNLERDFRISKIVLFKEIKVAKLWKKWGEKFKHLISL